MMQSQNRNRKAGCCPPAARGASYLQQLPADELGRPLFQKSRYTFAEIV
jgi:hypothetical protein